VYKSILARLQKQVYDTAKIISTDQKSGD